MTVVGAYAAKTDTGRKRRRNEDAFVLDSSGISIGRGNPNDVRLDADEYASANHARVEPRRDGVWIEDIGSTNGTFVNGVRLSRPRKLSAGDLVRVGETDLRFEA